MWWVDGKKIYLKKFEGSFEFDDSGEGIFPCDGFITYQKRDENLQGYRYNELTKNLQKQQLPFYILKPCIFYSNEIYFECPVLFGKVIIHEIVYKDYEENHFTLECTILSKKSHFKKTIHLNKNYYNSNIGSIPTILFNLNLLLSQDFDLRDINLSSRYLLLKTESIEILFKYINKLDISFKSFTAFKVGRDDSYHINAFLIPDKHYFSEYLNRIISNELENIRIESLNKIQFFSTYNDLIELVDLGSVQEHTFSESALFKDSTLELEIKDFLKLKLVLKFNPKEHLTSELVQKLAIAH